MARLPVTHLRAHRRARAAPDRRERWRALHAAHLAGSDERPDDLTGYLDHLAGLRAYAFHGSNRGGLTELRPEQPRDTREFGRQHAVYASPDPHWAMFFALVDRSNATGLFNGSMALSVNARTRWYQRDVRVRDPGAPLLTSGFLYVVPREPFRAEPRVLGLVDLAHWVSDGPVRPAFVLPVSPADYPMSRLIRRMPT